MLTLRNRPFLYAKIGWDDLFAFPELGPGSIARIDIRPIPDRLPALGPGASKSIFLVENDHSLNCGHLRRLDKRTLLCSARFPFTQVELRLGHRARILGTIDAEIRPFTAQSGPERTAGTQTLSKEPAAPADAPGTDLKRLLRVARLRVGISFRAASVLSQWIAHTLGDQTYFAAPGTLSDYENVSPPIHHIQKIVSLCVLYCIDFWTFLRVGGLPVDELGHDPLPDEMIPRTGLLRNRPFDDKVVPRHLGGAGKPGFLSTLIDQWEALPLFITSALPEISGLKNVSLSDIFWVGGNHNPIHPSLVGASLVAVNRRVKVPSRTTAPTVWEQPVYIVLLRDGSYVCGSCELRQGVLTVHAHSETPNSSIRLKNGIDAEVIGQVTAILRRLG